MKKLLFSLIVFSALLVIGCHEDSITDPASTESVNKDQNSNPYQHGFILLEGVLNDPHPVGNSFYVIDGQIEYEHRVISNNYVSLHLVTNANFQYLCTVCSPPNSEELVGLISNDSEDYFLISRSFRILEKTFTIQGREDGMILKCRFLVTTGGIELSAMWLALPANNVVSADQTNN